MLSTAPGARSALDSPGGKARLVLRSSGLLEVVDASGKRIRLLAGPFPSCRHPMR